MSSANHPTASQFPQRQKHFATKRIDVRRPNTKSDSAPDSPLHIHTSSPPSSPSSTPTHFHFFSILRGGDWMLVPPKDKSPSSANFDGSISGVSTSDMAVGSIGVPSLFNIRVDGLHPTESDVRFDDVDPRSAVSLRKVPKASDLQMPLFRPLEYPNEISRIEEHVEPFYLLLTGLYECATSQQVAEDMHDKFGQVTFSRILYGSSFDVPADSNVSAPSLVSLGMASVALANPTNGRKALEILNGINTPFGDKVYAFQDDDSTSLAQMVLQVFSGKLSDHVEFPPSPLWEMDDVRELASSPPPLVPVEESPQMPVVMMKEPETTSTVEETEPISEVNAESESTTEVFTQTEDVEMNTAEEEIEEDVDDMAPVSMINY
jgi:hypothetical protein